MNERVARSFSRLVLVCGLVLVASTSAGGQPERRLVRLSADGAGGGAASSATYTAVLAYGQPDAQGRAIGGGYAYAGGVFALLPPDRVFGDGFE